MSSLTIAMGSDYKSESDDDSDLLQLLLEDAEEEEEEEQQLLTAVLSSIPLIFDKREESYFRRHLVVDWSTHVSQLNCEGPNAFYKLYRMHYPFYMKLCSLLDDSVKKNSDMADVKSGNAPGSQLGVIITEIALHCWAGPVLRESKPSAGWHFFDFFSVRRISTKKKIQQTEKKRYVENLVNP